MKIHLVTIGKPKLAYAKLGFTEYCARLMHFHRLQVTHLHDKWAYDPIKLHEVAGSAYTVALVIDGGERLSSHQLADFMVMVEQQGRELCLLIGGPDGLPADTIKQANYRLSFSPLTFPHDLAMLITTEALYRATTINAGTPYHH